MRLAVVWIFAAFAEVALKVAVTTAGGENQFGTPWIARSSAAPGGRLRPANRQRKGTALANRKTLTAWTLADQHLQ
jgi:hypothetical protein